MKTHLILTTIAALTVATAGYAQSARELKVTVPFGFVAGSRAFPAGQYTVSLADTPNAVVIKSTESAPGVALLANQVASPGRQEIAKLVFHRYGDRYFLAEVWRTDQNVGSQIPKTLQEHRLAQKSRGEVATISVEAR